MQPQNKPKYTSIAQLLFAVESLTEELSQGEWIVLFALAHRVDWGTGGRREPAHPGNALLMKLTGATRQGVNFIQKRLIGRGLVECTRVGNGQGNASEFRICIEDPRFPETKAEPASDDLHVPEMENRKCNAGNPQVAGAEPASKQVGTRKQLLADDLRRPKNDLNPDHHAPQTGAAGGWWRANTNTLGQPTHEQRKQIEALEAEHGNERMDAVLKLWKQRPQGTADLNAKWKFFLLEFDTHITKARTAAELADEKEKVDAYIALQEEATRAFYGNNREGKPYDEILEAMVHGTYTPPPPKTVEEECDLEGLLKANGMEATCK